jgi:hypothetical protein
MVRASVAPPRPLDGKHAQRRAQRLIIRREHRLAPLRGAMLIDVPACPTLADTETVAQHRDRMAPPGRAHQFPLATSLSASMFNA